MNTISQKQKEPPGTVRNRQSYAPGKPDDAVQRRLKKLTQQESFAEKMLAALRNAFGEDAVKR